MSQFLLNNSIQLVALVLLVTVLTLETRKFMKRKSIDLSQFLVFLRQKIEELGNPLLGKLAAIAVVSFLVSLVSFREWWVNDVFHVVFLASLLLDRSEQIIRSVFK